LQAHLAFSQAHGSILFGDLVQVNLFGELNPSLHERLQLRSLIADLDFFGGERGAKLLALLEKDSPWDAVACSASMVNGRVVSA